MNCTQYRTALLADPHDLRPDMRLHLEGCADCAGYTDRLRRFEDRLDQALRFDVAVAARRAANVVPLRRRDPSRLEGAVHTRTRARLRGWLAAAASVVMAVLVAGALWLGAPRSGLAADVVTHMAEEPNAWRVTDTPVAAAALEDVLGESHVRLKANAGLVSYANSCRFRGHQVPHLVVQTSTGPVTVMILTHEATKGPQRFDDQGYRGIIVPVPSHGSLAVLERGPGPDRATMERVASRVLASIEWTG